MKLGCELLFCDFLSHHSLLPQLDRSTRELELGLDYGTPTMNLAGQNLKFENGQWVAGERPSCGFGDQDSRRNSPFHSCSVLPLDTVISGGVDRRETQRLRKRNQQLEEENNLLRLKVDILLDMVSKAIRKGCLGFPFKEALS